MQYQVMKIIGGELLECWKWELETVEEFKKWLPETYRVIKYDHYFLDDNDSSIRIDDGDYFVKMGNLITLYSEKELHENYVLFLKPKVFYMPTELYYPETKL